MKRTLLALCLSLAALSLAPPSSARAETVHFVTEEYPPFNFTKDGAIAGVSVDQVHAIAKAAGLDYTIEIMPWARAFALAEHQPMHCVFTATHTEERHDRFRWVEPLVQDVMVLVKRKGGGVAVHTLEDAMKLRIGAQRDDFAVGLLTAKGFRDIDLAADIDITLGKLLSGRIDLMPTSLKTFESMIAAGQPVEKAMVMDGQIFGLACNRQMPEAIHARLQAELDKLVLEGGQDRIFAAHGLANPRTAANQTKK